MPEYALYIRRYAPFASFGGGFEGDRRLYSTRPNATARTAAIVTFGPTARVSASGYSDGSAYVGPWEIRKSWKLGAIGKHIGQVKTAVTNASSADGVVAFSVHTEGNLPIKDVALHKSLAKPIDKANAWLRPGSRNPQISPDIDTFVDLKATFSGDSLLLEGTVRGDGFPNAEVFLNDGSGNTVGLLDFRTKSGAMGPLYRLFFSGSNNRLATFSRKVSLKPDGAFGPDCAGDPPITVEA